MLFIIAYTSTLPPQYIGCYICCFTGHLNNIKIDYNPGGIIRGYNPGVIITIIILGNGLHIGRLNPVMRVFLHFIYFIFSFLN